MPQPTYKQQITSADIYVSYKCNLRCKHCFLGDKLETSLQMPWPMLESIISEIANWGAEEITFLGGEPTIYPEICKAIELVQSKKVRSRIVTNGKPPLLNVLNRLNEPYPHICFSIDGATAQTHNRMRGPSSYQSLMESIRRSSALGLSMSAIASIDRSNYHEAIDLISLCDALGFDYLNIHYVTNRGSAAESSVLTIFEWLSLVNEVEKASKSVRLDVRIERTFAENSNKRLGCAVRDKTNLMFFPDGKVFRCAMFLDLEGSHSFTWQGGLLIPNPNDITEHTICSQECSVHCPAMEIVNPEIALEAKRKGLTIKCIYDKSCLRGGSEVADSHSMHL